MCRSRIISPGLQKWTEGSPGTGDSSEREQGATPRPACAWAGRGLCLPRVREVPLPPCQAAGLQEGEGAACQDPVGAGQGREICAWVVIERNTESC